MNQSPLVSVVIPTYNRADDIVDAVRSVRDQTYEPLEILVVDDASVDDTPLRIQEIQDDDLRYFRQDHNQGASASRNTGIQAARGDWIAFLDSDDRWNRRKIQRQLEVAEASEHDPGLVYSGLTVTGSDGEAVKILPSDRGDIYRRQLERDRMGPTSTWLVKSECFRVIGGFNESYPVRNDYEFSLRLSEEYAVEYVREPMVYMDTSRENRLSSEASRRIAVTERLIEEVVEPRASEFEEAVKNTILATQYFALGRYCQQEEHFEEARKYLLESLRYNTFKPKALAAYLLASVDLDVREEYYHLRDWIRRIRARLQV